MNNKKNMSEREDEMVRAINERAKNMLDNDESGQVREKVKTYADFKVNQAEKVDIESPRDFANTAEPQNPAPAPIQVQNIQENQTESSERKTVTFAAYGGFWRRLAASFLDYWPTWLVAIPIYGYVLFTMFSNGIANESFEGSQMEEVIQFAIPTLVVLVVAIINTAYNAYLYFTKGETIGYKLLGMKVISEKTGQLHATWPMIGRWAVKTVMTIIPYIGMIGLLVVGGMIAWNSKKKGPHDMAAGTLVVMEKVKRTWLVWTVNLFPLIFIPIIGILAGVLIATIQPAYQIEEASEAMARTQLSGFSTQAALTYATDTSYENFCEKLNIPLNFTCNDSKERWLIKDNKNNICMFANSHGVHENCPRWEEYGEVKNEEILNIDKDKKIVEEEEVFQG